MNTESVRRKVLRYLLNSPQEFRDLSRGKQITQIRDHYGWCDSSILTIARSLSYWQSNVHIAPANSAVEAKRFGKTRNNRAKAVSNGRLKGESLRAFQKRVLAKLPMELRELAQAELGSNYERNQSR